ncbi:TPR domain protein [Calothrix sp. NIES-4071]|nr:TPR domain protein [Calothrix sp. NIES-4071]BAZ54393.1 TPR domain protein [Calothrix sp. NIES-4105]
MKKRHHKLKVFTCLAFTVFISVLLLSQVGIVQARSMNVTAQQGETSNPAARSVAESVFNEGKKLYEQGTAKSLQQAIEKYFEALLLFRQVGDKVSEATTLNDIGMAYNNLGDYEQALNYYEQALTLRRLYDKKNEAVTLDEIGTVHNSLGKKQEALNYFNQSLELSQKWRDEKLQAITVNNIGVIYDDLGDYEQALKYYEQSLDLNRKLDNKATESTNLSNIGLVYHNLGYYEQSDNKQQATDYYNQAINHYEQSLKLTPVNDKAGRAITYSNIGAVYSDLDKSDLDKKQQDHKQQALDYHKQALPLSQEAGNKAVIATIFNNLGKAHNDLGNYQQALESYNQSLKLSQDIGNKKGETRTLFNLALLERSKNNLTTALTYIEGAIKIIEDLRKNISSQDLRTSYFAMVQEYYKLKTDVLMQLHKKDPSLGYNAKALNNNERSRARVLIELLAEANVKIRKGINPQLLEQESSLLQRITAKETQLINFQSQPKQDSIKTQKELENLLDQYRELQTKIRTKTPEYANILYPKPLELKQIQQQLDNDTVLLQYSLDKDRSYLWAVTPDSLHTYELPGQKQIEDAAEKFLKVVKSGYTPHSKANPDVINQPAYQLSQMILVPVANKLGKKRLVIVADGVLQSTPFAALADPTLKSTSTYQPLMVNHEIVNLPSITAIATHRQQMKSRQLAPHTLAVLADPVFEADDKRLTGVEPPLSPEMKLNRYSLQRALKNLKRNGMTRLKATGDEAEAILNFVSPKETIRAFGFDANYNFVSSPELKKYRFLLFATHGIVDTKNPELSGIVLSQFDSKGKLVERGYLHLSDIFNLDLGAELVVLSACETGLGKNVKGEGLIGLTRGLMYAGAKRAVVSLWQVDDKGTSILMPKFYEAVLRGKSPTVALREVQKQLWQGEEKEWQNPYYWAAFTLQGDWR